MKTQYKVALAMLASTALGGLAVEALHAQAKPPVFLVTEIDISNQDAYSKEYVPLAQASIKASGGRLLAASPNITAVEGTPPKSRVAIQQWDSIDKIKAWRSSTAYTDTRKIGDKYAKFRAYAVEGIPQ